MTALPTRARARSLSLFLGASIVLHAIAIVFLPQRAVPERGVEVLEVTLVRAEPPRVVERPEPRSAPAEAKPKAVPRAAPGKRAAPAPDKHAAAAPRGREVKPELLALPPQPAQQPVFSVPQPEPAPRAVAPEAPVEGAPRPEVARGTAPGSKGDSAPAEKPGPVMPPSFNASYLRNPPPRYPVSARRNGEQGTVTLKVLVTREGAASSVTVEKTSGSTALDQAAVEAVRSWRFAPARQGTQPVEAWVLVPIVFKLEAAS